MELFSYGHNNTVFDGFRNYNIDYFNAMREEYIFDKKLKACYRIWRSKHSKRTSEDNNEWMTLTFDTNLSPDFSFQHVDMKTGEAFSIYLVETEQRHYGNTMLTVQIQHIDAQQRLFENRECRYIKTLAGTVAKRLAFYKEQFDALCAEYFAAFQKDGFSVIKEHIIENLAAYVLTGLERRNALVYAYTPAGAISEVLVAFSALNGDCLVDQAQIDGSSGHLYERRDQRYQDLVAPYLPAEQTEALDRLMDFIERNKDTWHNLFAQFSTIHGGNGKIALTKLRNDLQALGL
ncbi:hypothetical protein [Burkholderia cenocepacia]|uniref:Uncharacterized protein n=1 Tax=Burkholderia cenocepacia TaxID=95486 RepID=A0ABD4UCG0_9BURK|nr:hypothetical protein [Burkholderia cenocepacia]MCW3696280.1 hypothetical protein [Burkholderia cenocepacia]MCW3704501.1 hypothetical protein [Burkholderia cenocepacia]MCW3712060.1 hypothetical protein [Burkholderia cenocepacia]MCW3720059.1 hypothetical protein [Burkholderia cenocepacia]MCW3727877.1 hypothetical protein [Burkholderia cenocepacia]